MKIVLHDIVGIFGSALIVVTYLLLQMRKMLVSDMRYSVMNAMGAGCILYSLSKEFNLSAFVIEFFWLLISFIGIFLGVRELLRRRNGNRDGGEEPE